MHEGGKKEDEKESEVAIFLPSGEKREELL